MSIFFIAIFSQGCIQFQVKISSYEVANGICLHGWTLEHNFYPCTFKTYILNWMTPLVPLLKPWLWPPSLDLNYFCIERSPCELEETNQSFCSKRRMPLHLITQCFVRTFHKYGFDKDLKSHRLRTRCIRNETRHI